MIPNVNRGVSAVRARNSTLPTRCPSPGWPTTGCACSIAASSQGGAVGAGAAAGPGTGTAPDASGPRRCDDHQRVVVRVAQPEQRRHRVADAADLGVDVDAALLELGVE